MAITAGSPPTTGSSGQRFATSLPPIRLQLPVISAGKLYETENARLLRRYFYEALDHGRAYYLYGAPGTQKTYVLQHLIAELNRSEIAKNGEGRRAYYIYVRQGIHSLDLMKRVAQSCGAIGMGTVDRILRNLRFDLSQRKVLLVFDEAQHLSIECLETLRELLDQPPHCGLLFAGTHELEADLHPPGLGAGAMAFPLSCRPGLARHLRGGSSRLSCTLSWGWDCRSGKSKS